jgi:hypothetical protein
MKHGWTVQPRLAWLSRVPCDHLDSFVGASSVAGQRGQDRVVGTGTRRRPRRSNRASSTDSRCCPFRLDRTVVHMIAGAGANVVQVGDEGAGWWTPATPSRATRCLLRPNY